MDKAVKKILETLSNQIDSNELAAAIKAENFEGEYAISEDGLEAIVNQTKELLTIESAIANPVVVEKINKENYPKHMKTALSKVEEKLKPLMDKVGVDYSNAEFISDAIGELETKLEQSISNGDSQTLIDSQKNDIAKLHEALALKEEEAENRVKALQDEYTQKELYNTYLRKANSYKWADVYEDPDLKEAILTKKWEKLQAKAHLKLSDSGDIQLFQKDMPEKELYEGNKIATFQSLLEPELESYLKKSAPDKVNKNEPAKKEEQNDLTPKQKAMIARKKEFALAG